MQNLSRIGNIGSRSSVRLRCHLVGQHSDLLSTSGAQQHKVVQHQVRILKNEPDRLAGLHPDFFWLKLHLIGYRLLSQSVRIRSVGGLPFRPKLP